MKIEVTSVDFDFESDGEILPDQEQEEVIRKVVGTIYDMDDLGVDFCSTDEEIDEALTDAITDQTGWCIKNIDYNFIITTKPQP
jgi:hypothetical protein